MGVHTGLQVDMPVHSRMVWEYCDWAKEMVWSFQSLLISIPRMNFAFLKSRILKAAESCALTEFMNFQVEAAKSRSLT